MADLQHGVGVGHTPASPSSPINIAGSTTPDHPTDLAISFSKSSFGGHVPALNAISEHEDDGGLEDETEAEAEELDPDDGRGSVSTAEHAERAQIGGGMLKETVITSGYLLKRGERRKAWKKRYFVLRPDRLCYYKDDKEYQILRKVAITDIHACARVEVKRRSNTFGIVTPKRTYYVEAPSPDRVDEWVSSINAARRSMRRQLSNHPSGDVTPLATKAPTPVDLAEQAQSLSNSIQLPASFSEQSNISSLYSSSPATASTSYAAPSFSEWYQSPSSNTSAIPMPRRPSEQSRASMVASSSVIPQSISSVISTSFEHSPPREAVPGQAAGSLPISSGLAAQSVSANVVSSSEEDEDDTDVTTPHQAAFPDHKQDTTVPIPTPAPPLASAATATATARPSQIQMPTQAFSPGQPSMLTPSTIYNASPGPSMRKPVLSGYLIKQGKRKNWRKRWFTLDPQKLVYTRSHIDTKVHRSINLDSILDVMEYTPGGSSSDKNGLQSAAGPLSPLLGQPSDVNNAGTGAGNTTSAAPSTGTGTGGGAAGGAGGGGGGSLGGGKKQVQHSFKIITPARTFLVCAPSEEDEIKWLSALRVLIAAARKPEALATPNFQPPQPQSQPSQQQ